MFDSLHFLEIVRIDALHVIGACRRDADLEVDHEVSEPPAIDQGNLGSDVFNVGRSIGCPANDA